MTDKAFQEVLDKQLAECNSILGTKGTDYTDGNDRFSNFKIVGGLAGLSPEMVWLIYWIKHVIAIVAYCQRGQVESEPIEGRITDAVNYLLLLRGMIEERKAAAGETPPSAKTSNKFMYELDDTTARMLKAAGVDI